MAQQNQVTLSDIAKILNVTKVTVSKALRDHPDISDAMKKKVKETALKMGYTPNFIARNLTARKSNTIGLVVPKVAHHFFASAIETVYNTAFENNYEIIMTVSQEDDRKEIRHIQTLLSMRVDGLLVSVSKKTKNTDIFRFVKRKKIPLVFFDRVIEGIGFSCVSFDDEDSTYNTIKEIIRRGYTKIAHIAGFSYISIGKHRLHGYRRAMAESNLPIASNWIVEGGFSEADGRQGLKKIVEGGDLPQVIFAVTYPVALGVMAEAAELGLKISEDFELISYGGSDFNQFIKPRISYINQPAPVLAKKAMELLLDELKDSSESHPEQIIRLPAEFITLDTCRGDKFADAGNWASP